MYFGYPGGNTHLEQHGVSEESFWPSFTDIMMVIVMVFLLVTVTVILNNWTLIADLKNSIKAQQIASSLAENTQEKNHTLEDKLIALADQVEDLSKKYRDEKTNLLASQQELVKTRRLLLEKEASLSTLETRLSEEQAALNNSQNELSQKQQMLIALQTELKNSNALINKNTSEKEKYSNTLANLQNEQSQTKAKLEQLQIDYSKLQTSLKDKTLAAKNSQLAFAELEKTQQEKTQLIATLNTKLKQQDNELKSKDKELLALKNKKNTDEAQLRSLQGEYDSLDAKYQKLLQPARSSKGKFVVSVLYRKTAGRKVIRLKSSPTGTYQNITETQLHKKLATLKNKYKTKLYLKVVIPENSGLSYSEAWKFTSGLQNQYDYYFQKKVN